jgi:hypothetical protein
MLGWIGFSLTECPTLQAESCVLIYHGQGSVSRSNLQMPSHSALPAEGFWLHLPLEGDNLIWLTL